MTIHLIKLAVGPHTLSELEAWQKQRLKEKRATGQTPQLVHITRQMPKRAGELLDGGSLYWVIKGYVVARQKLLELRPLDIDGVPHCGLVYDREMIRVVPRAHRPFQGWRYLDPAAAPRDMQKGEEDISDEMRRQLAEAGLL